MTENEQNVRPTNIAVSKNLLCASFIYFATENISDTQLCYINLCDTSCVSCYLENPEFIIMILHEPDVALQN